MKRGKFIVIEGIDGSGKATQANLLTERLKTQKYQTETIDFPQYGTKSAGLVEEYLNGKYGKAEDVNPEIHSIFYAVDRYDGGFKIRNWLSEDKVVICDRYTFSNVGHAGAKIPNLNKWKKYTDWVCDLEFNFFNIPKPDIVIILKNTAKRGKHFSGNITDEKKLKKKALYLGEKKQDIHEKNERHLDNAMKSYLRLASYMPKLCKVVDVESPNGMRSREEIHEDIWHLVSKMLK